MDSFQELVGDGKAKIRVCQDMGIKDYGTGVNARVELELTVNQDQGTIHRAIELASPLLLHYVKILRDQGEQELQAIMNVRYPLPPL